MFTYLENLQVTKAQFHLVYSVTYSHVGLEGLHNLTFDDPHSSGSKWGQNKVILNYLGISWNRNYLDEKIITMTHYKNMIK